MYVQVPSPPPPPPPPPPCGLLSLAILLPSFCLVCVSPCAIDAASATDAADLVLDVARESVLLPLLLLMLLLLVLLWLLLWLLMLCYATKTFDRDK